VTSPPAGRPPGGEQPPTLATQSENLLRLHGALTLSNRKYKTLFELAPVGYLYLSPAGQVQEANVAAARLFGQPGGLLTRSNVQVFIRNEDRAALRHHLRRVTAGETDTLEVRALHSDGRQVPVSIRSTAILDADGAIAGLHMAVMDISSHKDAEMELRRAKDHLQHLAHHDPLTHLPNRALFSDRLHQALIRAQRRMGCVALLFVDIDRFKFINDSFGHQAGDQFLCEVARRIRRSVRAMDTVARIGGDEFTVILERIDHRRHAEEVARKILDSLRQPVALGPSEHQVPVTSSIGIAVYPEDGMHSENLIRHADAAMFAAKERGRNRIECFSAALDERTSGRVAIESELRDVAAHGQLRLLYQPQFDGNSGRIVGVEALLRWQHPVRGLLRPAEFIHVAEDSGLIEQLGRWVLREACRQGRLWHERGHPIRIAVNVSTRQLAMPDFIEDLAAALRDSCLPGDALELEITESTLLVNADAVLEQLHGMRTLGVQVAIDNFGTGLSSLGRLRRLPIAKLKIDRSFVQGIPHSRDDSAVARAIISIVQPRGQGATGNAQVTSHNVYYVK
jgi:diguanylate cyclase (GGDEF)-like protein/PAS domain S-box-containing protein